ncbi:MAG: hypothetical protein ACPHCT_03920, partial [Flavobacteriales bacterium]
MKNWEDILRERLRSFRGPDVPGQEEAMWQNIDAALGAPTAASAPWWRNRGLQVGAAAAVLLALGLTLTRQDKPVEPSTTERAAETTTESSTESAEGQTVEAIESTDITQSEAVEAVQTVETNGTVEATETTEVVQPYATETASIEGNSNQMEVAASSVDVPPTSAQSAPMVEAPTAEGAEDIAAVTEDRKPKSEPALPMAPSALPEVESETIELGAMDRLDLRDIRPIQSAWNAPFLAPLADAEEPRTPLAIRVFTGPTRSQFSMESGAPEHDVFHADFSAGGGVMLEVNGDLRWSVGFAWHDYVHSLQHTDVTETAIFTPGVVSITINTQTGDTLAIEEGLVAGVEERVRTVDLHNRFRAYSIPVEWRTFRSRGRFQFGVGLGAMLQIRSRAYGSILDSEGEITGYSDGNLSRGRLTVMPTVRAFSGVRFAPGWRADVGLATGIQRHNSRPIGDAPSPVSTPTWQGQLVNTQLQLGLTRFLWGR